MSRPAYIERKIELERSRSEHRRWAPPGCRCPFCLTADQLHELAAERARLSRMLAGEPPF